MIARFFNFMYYCFTFCVKPSKDKSCFYLRRCHLHFIINAVQRSAVYNKRTVFIFYFSSHKRQRNSYSTHRTLADRCISCNLRIKRLTAQYTAEQSCSCAAVAGVKSLVRLFKSVKAFAVNGYTASVILYINT